ncbi:uncharacterized protein [Cicer arietinum]|uniref:uncharacterized protein n=1 Tax=Cicer arietinum TaxID=3827 RepID=UPI00032A505C
MLKFFSTTALVSSNGNIKLLLTKPFSISLFSLNFKFCSTSTFDPHAFTVSYLIDTCGFSPETASNVSQKITLTNTQKPDSVLDFFRTFGFSNSQLRDILRREIGLLSCDPKKVVLPKFQFLLSKGASNSDIVRIVTASPRLLKRSLENHIIPAYESAREILQSDKQTIASVKRFCYLCQDGVESNIKLMLDNGVSHSNIARLFNWWPSIFCSSDLLITIEELKELGFNSTTSAYSSAFLAKRTVTKDKWAEKVETFKKWGWSDEQIIRTFRKQPFIMLVSRHKVNAIMSFWVYHLGFDSLDIVKCPAILQLSLEKRIIPRASVVQFLASKGLRRKGASKYTPYLLSEKLFRNKFVKGFEEHSSYLLKLYEEKISVADSSQERPSAGVNHLDQILV